MSTPIRVRGLLVRSQRRAMEELAGPAAVQEVLGALPAADRLAYEEASALSWVPQPTVREVTRLVAGKLGISGEAMAERVVHTSVSEACSGPWNVLLRWCSDDALIGRAARLFSRAFDAGDLTARRTHDGFELTLEGWPEPDRMDLVSLRAGVLATLSATGRAARVDLLPHPTGARYLVRLDRKT